MQLSGPSAPIYAAVIVVAAAVGLVNAYVAVGDNATHRNIGLPLMLETANLAVIALLLPLLFAAVQRIRAASTWTTRAVIGVAALLIVPALHVAGTVLLRTVVTALAGGPDDFGLSSATLTRSVLTCVLIGGAFWLFQSKRTTLAPVTALPDPLPAARAATDTTPATTPTLWLREGAGRIRVEPKDVIWVSSAGHAVEFTLHDGRTHLIPGTLASAETRLKPLNFVRVHRTRLVNMAWIKELEPGTDGDFTVVLRNGQTVAGSRRYRHALASLDGLADARSAPPP